MAERVLIAKLGAIGDVVMVLPAARALYEAGYAVEWVCGPVVEPLLKLYPWIETVVVDDRALLKGGAAERARALLGLWRRLAGRQYTLAATLYYDARYKALLWPVRAKKKIMLSREDRELQLLPGRAHADEWMRILLGLKDSVRPESATPVRPERLPEVALPERRGVRVGLAPGGSSNMLRQQTLRRWPVESYAAVARELLERGCEVLLLGGPEDGWVRESFAGMAVMDAVGRLTLPEVIAACDTCDVVVSHDTGPLHLAGLSTAGVVALFGPTEPGSFLPRRAGVRAIWGGEGFACRPCYDGREFALCERNACMEQVTPAMVLQQIDALLAERAAGAGSAARVMMPSELVEIR